MAIGDLDQQGQLDLAMVGAQGLAIVTTAYHWQLAVHGIYPAGVEPAAVAIADLDGDGDEDVVVANHGSKKGEGGGLTVHLNAGAGVFAPAVQYAAGLRPLDVATGDLDADGDVDVVVADEGAKGRGVSVLLNAGNGTFAPAVHYEQSAPPLSVVVGDVDRDGDLDLATTNYPSGSSYDGALAVLVNDGHGAFGSAMSYQLPGRPQDVVIGDLDGDGDGDMAVARDDYYVSKGGDVAVLLRDCVQ
ncbi:MAG: VCBS repeat-containing protein [Deltaproteobacteria bacterium]|nr:VCBS repeat-containing protein [Deltaproteobacteria bacterium]